MTESGESQKYKKKYKSSYIQGVAIFTLPNGSNPWCRGHEFHNGRRKEDCF